MIWCAVSERIEAAARVAKFCDEYEQLRGVDPDRITTLHLGHKRECVLSVSDLRILARAAATDLMASLAAAADGVSDHSDACVRNAEKSSDADCICRRGGVHPDTARDALVALVRDAIALAEEGTDDLSFEVWAMRAKDVLGVGGDELT